MAKESVASRYNRDWLQLEDDRKERGYDARDSERRARDYVNPATGVTVGTTGDNDDE